MKAFKLIALFVMAITVSGCNLFFGHDPIGFGLKLSFQDASGKNLVEGIEYIVVDSMHPSGGAVKPELYTLRLFEDGKKLYPRGVQGEDFSAIKYLRYTEHLRYPLVSHYLCLDYGGTESQKTFTAFLSCPYIFGDSIEHEITAYCKRKGINYVCNRLAFDGEEVDMVSSTIAVIVLD